MKAVHLSWNPVVNDAQGTPLPLNYQVNYKVYSCLATGSYTTPLLTTTDTQANITLPAAGNYKACVTASGTDGDSAQSNQVNFPVVPLVPAAPTELIVS